MSRDKRQARNLRIGIAGCYLFALISLGIAMYETRTLLHLLKNGKRADAVVVEIDVGTKGGKKAVFQFTTESGEQVSSHDLLQMFLIRHDPGDAVIVLYDPSDTKIATIDIGPWMWQEPGFLYFGFVFLFGLGVLLSRGRRPSANTAHANQETTE